MIETKPIQNIPLWITWLAAHLPGAEVRVDREQLREIAVVLGYRAQSALTVNTDFGAVVFYCDE